MLWLSIESWSSFIKQKNSWFANKGSCNRNSLFLTTRQLNTSFTDNSLFSFWEKFRVIHESENICLSTSKVESVLLLLLTETGHISAIENVLTNRAWEESRFLLHNRNLSLMVPLVVNLFEVYIIVQNFSFIRVIEPLNKLHYRWFTTT